MLQREQAPGKYAIAEPWRPISRSDGLKLGPRVREAFIEVLENGPNLVYYRQKPRADWMPLYTIVAKRKPEGETAAYSIGNTVDVEGLDLIVMMIEGKIAHCAVREGQLVFLGNKLSALGGYLREKAKQLDRLSPYFKNVPSTGEHLQQEIKTLKKLDESYARLRRGNISKKDLELFWLGK